MIPAVEYTAWNNQNNQNNHLGRGVFAIRMAEDPEPTETTTLNSLSGCGEDGEATEVAMVAVTNENAHLPGRHCNVQDGDTADETHLQRPENKDIHYVVIVKCEDTYLKTLPGVLRFLQVMFSVIGLICLTSSGVQDGGYLLLPLAWHLRVFVFVSVCGFLTSVVLIFLHTTTLITTMPLNWPLFDFCVYGLLSFFYLFATSLVASAIDFYQKLDKNVTQWTEEQLIVSVVLGYMCLFLYGATAVIGYRRWKGAGQFRRYRFKNPGASQRGRRSRSPSVV